MRVLRKNFAPSEAWLVWALVLAAAARLVLLIFGPICDPTESRYAEIARKMAETGNWITPQFDYGVPFWGKPPLAIWISAAGIRIFGANEFGARILGFLLSGFILWLVYQAVRREFNKLAGLSAALILATTPLFFYCSATVMTDLALVCGTTLIMLGFRRSLLDDSRAWGYAIFLGGAIGLLAKGPLALVIALPPIVLWIALTKNARATWKNVPWISGTLLMLALSVPWYLLAEWRTPGFWNYFFIGEHWQRFTQPGWKGDLYGQGHTSARGLIWFFALATSLPWCLALFRWPFARWRNLRAWSMENDGRGLYWLLWLVWPLIFFTPARNVIASYPLPAFPALAILLAEIFEKKSPRGSHPIFITLAALIIAATLVLTFVAPRFSPKQSERGLVRFYFSQRQPDDRLVYFQSRKFSAEFYARGRVEHFGSLEQLATKLALPGRFFLATSAKNFSKLPAETRAQFEPAGFSSADTTLYREVISPR